MTHLRGKVTPRLDPSLLLVRVFLCVVVALEATTYGVISPLLPGIARDLALEDSLVGLITGAFTAGLLPACLALMLVRRPVSDIAVVLGGLMSLAVGCLTLANGGGLTGILVGRLLMGFGSGLCFGGTIRWLVKSAPGNEGLFFGLGWGMLSVGTAVGPAVGAVGVVHGSRLVHNMLAGVIVVCVAVLALTAKSPRMRRMARARAEGPPVALANVLRERTFRATLTPLITPALAIGVLFTLVPLRLAGDGHERWVAATFVAAAVIGAGAGPVAGFLVRYFDKGPMTVVALVASTALLVSLAWPIGPLTLTIVTIAILGVSNQLVTVAAGETIRRAGEELGVPDTSSTFVPLVFAVFETAGAVLSTRAEALSPSLPFIALGSVAAVSGLLAWRTVHIQGRRVRRRRPQH